MVRIGVCDDVPFCVECLAECIVEWARQKKLQVQVVKLKSGEEVLLEQEVKGDFSVVFMDIELEGMDGMEAALRLREKNRQVGLVFVTAHECYLKDMFRLYPVQFLEKPIESGKVWEVLERITEEKGLLRENFLFLENRGYCSIALGQVLYFTSEKRVIRIVMEGGSEHVFYEKLDALEKRLLSYNHSFLRIHKSYLVNERQIEQYRASCVVMRNGDILTVSRDKRSHVRCRHMNWIENSAKSYIS